MNKQNNFKLAKYACYITNVSMSVVANLSPLLFVTFYNMYNVSYALLGLLVAVNFSTQLIIDLIFAFLSKHFNIIKTIKFMPLIAFFGFLVYGIMPLIFPDTAYLFIIIGTVIISISSGFNEVLASPLIAAIPSDNPESEMSKLHSTYAWGVVAVVIISTLFLKLFGTHNWNYLAILWSLVPLSSFFIFLKADLPPLVIENKKTKTDKSYSKIILLCFMIIFLGGAAECTMAQWISGFMESAMNIPKLAGDILGAAVFALLLAGGRILYAKHPKKILNVMFIGMCGAFLCYVTAGVSQNQFAGLFTCALTGIFVSMLWPGTLIYLEEKVPGASVAVYALMAAGGDMGAALVPQLVGIIADSLGIQAGILLSSIFPLMGVLLIGTIILGNKRNFFTKSKV